MTIPSYSIGKYIPKNQWNLSMFLLKTQTNYRYSHLESITLAHHRNGKPIVFEWNDAFIASKCSLNPSLSLILSPEVWNAYGLHHHNGGEGVKTKRISGSNNNNKLACLLFGGRCCFSYTMRSWWWGYSRAANVYLSISY